jgi:hypothetical protein
MRLGASLTLITIGAILMFAVRADSSWLDIQMVGLILALVGIGGMIANHIVWERRKQAAAMPRPMDDMLDPEMPVPPSAAHSTMQPTVTE